ncbi:MAG: M14 family zinc carboxypeptidase, partial [Planctomycetota bacterium]
YKIMCRLFANYDRHPNAEVVSIGNSLEGRPIKRLVITAAESELPLKERRVHYFTNQHPGEHNAQWRMMA